MHLILASLALLTLAAAPSETTGRTGAASTGSEQAPAGNSRPEHLGSPAKSSAALPAWQPRPLRQLLPGQVPYAPASEDAEGLYDQADPKPAKTGPLRDAALACTVDLGERRFDDLLPFANPSMVYGDLCAVAGPVPPGGPVRDVTVHFGADDANTVTFLVPLVSLDPGQAVSVRLLDIDLQFDDAVDTLKATYRGTLPLSLATRGVKGDCRLVTREALEALLPPHLEATDAALAKARNAFRASLDDRRPMSVDGTLLAPQRSLAGAAALVGWDDPRVAARVALIADLDRELTAQWAEVFEAARKKASGRDWATVAGGQLEVRFAGLRCGRELSAYAGMNLPGLRAKDACALHVGVRNRTDRPLALDFRLLEPLDDLVLVDGRGASREATFEGQWKNGRASALPAAWALEPGQEGELVVAPDMVDGVLKKSRLPLLLRGSHAANVSSRKPSSVDLAGGEAGLEVVDYACGAESLSGLADAAGVPSWRRPVCGLHVRLANRAAEARAVKLPDLRGFSLLGPARKAVESEGVVLLGPKPRVARPSDTVPAAGKTELMLLFRDKDAPASLDELRLVVPGAKGYFFVLVDGS